MKCFHGNSRGISLAAKILRAFSLPVVFAESLLKQANSRFGDKLVFADAVKLDGKIVLSAQANEDDNRALIVFEYSSGQTDDDHGERFFDRTHLHNATLIHDERCDDYHGLGVFSSTRRVMLLAEEDGGAFFSTTSMITHQPGFLARLRGAKQWTEEVTSTIQIRYDGENVFIYDIPNTTRHVVDELPARGGWRAILA